MSNIAGLQSAAFWHIPLTMSGSISKYFSRSGKRAVVTGAGRGIGRSIAEALAGAGASVCAHYFSSREAAQKVVAGIEAGGGEAWAAHADLTDSDQTKAFFDEIGNRWDGLDILINNSGDLVRRTRIEECTDKLLDDILHVNIHSAVYSIRCAIPMLRGRENAGIINLGSIAGMNGGGGGSVLYAATKGALHTMTSGLAKELAPEIRVNAIAPGVVLTDFHARNTTADSLAQLEKLTPLGRHGVADDIAAAAVYLSGSGASFVTGQTLHINGGLWVG